MALLNVIRASQTGLPGRQSRHQLGGEDKDQLRRLGKEFVMRRDSRGNVVQALHKGIVRIEYDPTPQRIKSIRITDGRLVTFAYYDVKGSIRSSPFKTRYVRDEDGRVLASKNLLPYDGHHPAISTVTKDVVVLHFRSWPLS